MGSYTAESEPYTTEKGEVPVDAFGGELIANSANGKSLVQSDVAVRTKALKTY